ncbi:hypothetical protein PPERSA_02491 [Pseudocohnilembus persalinus]|uniref:Uncharacterized protein n=1 Tax=Pseudocohnilembus persalinus TaxID=266149 RepID=A0A0V0QAY4_PSEPJ|nr:hypothetical protein PPERSA_02491 [Pseudocohnilembus persalinus]|eukprot:KRW99379.1 hypothetical protein PPERSA_02491 [Pseudocohnilembus persalinus]
MQQNSEQKKCCSKNGHKNYEYLCFNLSDEQEIMLQCLKCLIHQKPLQKPIEIEQMLKNDIWNWENFPFQEDDVENLENIKQEHYFNPNQKIRKILKSCGKIKRETLKNQIISDLEIFFQKQYELVYENLKNMEDR